MSHHTAAFLDVSSFEGTAVNAETIDFARGSYQVTVTNDHSSAPLSFKFDAAENYLTALAGESITVDMQALNIMIDGNGASVPYRIWAFT